MKRILMIAYVLLFLLVGIAAAYSETFFDDFNDGNTEGWWLSPRGNWSIEDGSLRQDNQGNGEDWVMGLVENLEISDQIIETKVNTQGYGGVVFWHQDQLNYVSVIIYPLRRGLNINDADEEGGVSLRYNFPTTHNTWYTLRVNANSLTGELDIYIDDSYIFTYKATTMKRTGLSGVTSGNGGAYFDDFMVTQVGCDADYDGDGKISNKDQIFKRRDIFEQAAQEALEEFNYWQEYCFLPESDSQ